jgi:hypothetical protein
MSMSSGPLPARLAISTSYWPMVWPSPAPVTVTVFPERCGLELPQRPPCADDDALPPFEPPSAGPPPPYTDVHEGGIHRRRSEDPATGEVVFETELDLEPDGSPSLVRYDDIGVETGQGIRETFRIRRDDPLSARVDVLHRTFRRHGGITTRTELRASLTADETHFHYEAALAAHEGESEVAQRRWSEKLPRNLL